MEIQEIVDEEDFTTRHQVEITTNAKVSQEECITISKPNTPML